LIALFQSDDGVFNPQFRKFCPSLLQTELKSIGYLYKVDLDFKTAGGKFIDCDVFKGWPSIGVWPLY
jgi:hypothetical protein